MDLVLNKAAIQSLVQQLKGFEGRISFGFQRLNGVAARVLKYCLLGYLARVSPLRSIQFSEELKL